LQAEDGIRDWSVTGVQTCALPILNRISRPKDASKAPACADLPSPTNGSIVSVTAIGHAESVDRPCGDSRHAAGAARAADSISGKIGRASCRERGEMSGGAEWLREE